MAGDGLPRWAVYPPPVPSLVRWDTLGEEGTQPCQSQEEMEEKVSVQGKALPSWGISPPTRPMDQVGPVRSILAGVQPRSCPQQRAPRDAGSPFQYNLYWGD